MAGKYCKTPTVFQMEATECGAASMAMICAYWGKYIPLEKMRVETGVTRDGCNARNIMRAGKRFGMEVHGYRKNPEDLRELQLPCIIHWNFNHFVVFEGYKGKYAYINDPASGRRQITLEELDESFTGVVLTFKPTSEFVKEGKKSKLIPLIRERMSGYGMSLFQIVGVGILLILPGLILPVLSQVFLDEILGKQVVSWFVKFISFMVCTILFEIGLSAFRYSLLKNFQNKLLLISVKRFLDKMFRLPINFFAQRYSGDLVSRVSNNNNLNVFLTGDMAEIFLNIIVALFYMILLFVYNPIMTVVGILGVVINLFVAKLSASSMSNQMMKLQQDKGKLAGALCAGFSVMSTLRACGAESMYASRILGFDAKASSQEQRVSAVQTVIDAIPAAVSNIFDVVLLVLGANFIIKGDMTLGMLSAYIALYGSFSDPIEKLVGIVKKVQTLKSDMERVDDIMNYSFDTKFETKKDKNHENKKISGRVECRQVAFGYDKLKDALVSDFSFELSAGSSIAFVGKSGCGKSTVSKLISGLYQPWEGEILLDGLPMNAIPSEIMNASVSTVSQNISLFSGTIRENLTLWNPAVLEKDMIRAAKDACIHDVITKKPGAYDFCLTEGAANLSGGQRQRLEIARALVTNPTILIMDEATSALDPIVEKEIIDNIKRRGCTCIIVAHRLSAVRNCDEILVMSGGKVVERGEHNELVRMDGYYKEFMKMD